MANPLITRTLDRVSVLRRLPVTRLLVLADLVVLVREHVTKLEPHERHRLAELIRRGRGRPSSLSERDRRELASLLAKTEPREFVNRAVQQVTGVPVAGRRRGRR